jgi:F-type H+-transporting ATPase subunit delta
MSTGVISQRYARALMNLAAKANQVEAVAAELDGLADTLVESEELTAFFGETRVPQTAKQNAVEEILKKAESSELVSAFARFITQKRRVLLLDEIRTVYHRLADERLGRAQAEVTVAAPLSDAEQQALREKLEAVSGKQITITVTVEPGIIGGVITKIGSSVRDGSLRSQLNQIRQTIIEG